MHNKTNIANRGALRPVPVESRSALRWKSADKQYSILAVCWDWVLVLMFHRRSTGRVAGQWCPRTCRDPQKVCGSGSFAIITYSWGVRWSPARKTRGVWRTWYRRQGATLVIVRTAVSPDLLVSIFNKRCMSQQTSVGLCNAPVTQVWTTATPWVSTAGEPNPPLADDGIKPGDSASKLETSGSSSVSSSMSQKSRKAKLAKLKQGFH